MPKRSLNTNIELLNSAVELLMSLTKRNARAYANDAELAPLLKIADELRDLPHPSFKERLKADLQRSTSMPTETVAATRTSLAPRITFKDAAKAMEFYKNAFGAKETFRFDTGSGIPHAEMTIGDSVLFVTEEWPEGNRFSAETLGNSPVMMSLQVPDVDAFVDHAVAAGATLILPPTNQFYGHRDATVADPFGYKWSVSTIVEDMSVEEMHRRFRAAMPPRKKPEGSGD